MVYVVIVRLRSGAVRAETAHLNYEVFVNGVLLGYYETKADAESYARAATHDAESYARAATHDGED